MQHTFAILAYKQSKYLVDCINSLLIQTHPSKIIITSSTSSEFLTNIANQFSIPLLINHTPHCSIADDWNFALRNINTKYATLAHQDDIFFSDYTENILNINKDFLIAFTNYYELSQYNYLTTNNINLLIKKIILTPFYIKNNISNKFIKKIILSIGSPIACPTVTYNMNKINDFSFSNDFKINLDWDAWLRLSKYNGSFHYISKPLLYHRIHEDSETTSGIMNNIRYQEDLQILSTIWGKNIAKIIEKIYQLSYLSNKI